MRILPTRLGAPVVLEPTVHLDERGFFLEASRIDQLEAAGIHEAWVQDNHSRSVRRTLRGLHFQAGQAKLVRVVRGLVWDVVVDLRDGSPTFGEWESFTLDDVTHHALYVPAGFAHGFCVLSEEADVVYRVSSYYDPQLERGLAWNDPDVNIGWPTGEPLLSERDAHDNLALRALTNSPR